MRNPTARTRPGQLGQSVVHGCSPPLVDGGHDKDGRGVSTASDTGCGWLAATITTLAAHPRRTPERMVNMSATAQGLCEFIDASPSPFHVCVTVAERLRAAGFTELAETDAWPAGSGRFFTVRAGSLVAWDSRRAGPAVPDHRRSHRQPQSAGQATSRPVGRRLAGGRASALRRRVAELLAGPRSGHQRTALGPARRLRERCRAAVGAHRRRRSCGCRSWPSTSPTTATDVTLDPQRHVNAVWGLGSGTAVVPGVRRRTRGCRRGRRARRPT